MYGRLVLLHHPTIFMGSSLHLFSHVWSIIQNSFVHHLSINLATCPTRFNLFVMILVTISSNRMFLRVPELLIISFNFVHSSACSIRHSNFIHHFFFPQWSTLNIYQHRHYSHMLVLNVMRLYNLLQLGDVNGCFNFGPSSSLSATFRVIIDINFF